MRIIAAEPAACPTLTRGVFSYDYGDTVGMTPLMPMYTLGHDFVPPPVHAGGLRYHGDAPMVCALVRAGRVEARAYHQNETFEAAVRFARTEGIIPAPEPAHAIRAVIEEASDGEEKTILFGLCGHGHFDLAAYDAYLAAGSRTRSSPSRISRRLAGCRRRRRSRDANLNGARHSLSFRFEELSTRTRGRLGRSSSPPGVREARRPVRRRRPRPRRRRPTSPPES